MKDTKEQIIKEKENLNGKKKTKSKKIMEKGITLIALAVTIIILLILTGVTLNIALSDNGLFKKAKEAVDKYEKAQKDEEEAIRQISTQMYSEYVGAIVTGYTPITNSCTIGTETSGVSAEDAGKSNYGFENIEKNGEQNFETETIQWRIWDFDGNTLRIIGDPTKDTLTLKGAAGYNNGVWAMIEVCEICYSNGKEGIKVSNLKRSDIQKVSTYDYTQFKHKKDDSLEFTDDENEISGDLIYFGEAGMSSNGNYQFPQLWKDNDQLWTYEYDSDTGKSSGEDREGEIWEKIGTKDGKMSNEMESNETASIFKQSYYYHIYNKEEFINEKYFDLIFKTANEETVNRYWLGTRDTGVFDNYCDFGYQFVEPGEEACMSACRVCRSDGSPVGRSRAVRPIVSIDLKSSKCTMTTEIGEDGNVKTCKLSFENDNS